MAFTTSINSTLNAETLVNFSSQTTKFCCLISNHSSLTLHLLHMCMIMQLRSGVMTLLRTKLQPFNCPPQSHLRRRVASPWSLPHISTVMLCYITVPIFYNVPVSQY